MNDYVRRIFEGEAPCDKCKQAYKCEIEELACRAFSYYVRTGTFSPDTPRSPTNYLFNLIFKDDDVALKNYHKNLGGQGELL